MILGESAHPLTQGSKALNENRGKVLGPKPVLAMLFSCQIVHSLVTGRIGVSRHLEFSRDSEPMAFYLSELVYFVLLLITLFVKFRLSKA